MCVYIYIYTYDDTRNPGVRHRNRSIREAGRESRANQLSELSQNKKQHYVYIYIYMYTHTSEKHENHQTYDSQHFISNIPQALSVSTLKQ